ncbi:MAG: hypothetical protein HYY25_04040 [Candidatus Wallbacteria bacterium]|nr:hypothetical protein [Candidatus Wallbacteria bacterium]
MSLLLAAVFGLTASAAELPPLFDADGKAVEAGAGPAKKHRILMFAGLDTPAEQDMLGLVQENLKRIRRSEAASLWVVFVARTPRQAADYCRAREYSFPWLCDPAARWLAPLEVDYLPTVVVLAPDGSVLYRATAISQMLVQSVLRHPERVPAAAR